MNNATIALNDATPTFSKKISGSGVVTGSAGLKLSGAITIAHHFELGDSALIKIGGDRLLLDKSAAANVNVGGFVCQGGWLCLPSAYSSETPITLEGGTLQRNGESSGDGGVTTTLANPIYVTSTGGGLMAGWNGVLNLTGNISDAEGQTGGTLTIKKDSGNVQLSGDGVVNISGFLSIEQQNSLPTSNLVIQKNTQFGGLTGVGYATNNGIMTLNVAEGKTAQYDGVLSGSGSLVKTGAGTQIFSKAQTYTGTTTIQQGAIELAVGVPVAFDKLKVEGGQFDIQLKSDTEYGTFTMATLPDYNKESGFLGLHFLDGYYPASTSQMYEISDSIVPLTVNTNLEDWLLDDLRHEWNLNWVAGTEGGLFLSRDSNAIPEPGTWVLALLGMVGLCFVRRRSRA